MASGSYRYRVRRDKRNLHANKQSFLYKRSGERVGRPHLCQAMEATLNPSFLQDDAEPLRQWDGFPWVTMVLGSGCLDLPETSDAIAEIIAQRVRDKLKTVLPKELTRPGADGPDLLDRAERFTRSLVRDRIGLPNGPVTPFASDSDPDPDQDPQASGDSATAATEELLGEWKAVNVDVLTARMVALASLLTHFFHRACSVSGAAISRWDDDVAVLGRREQWSGAALLRSEVIDPSLELMDGILSQLEPTRPDNAMHDAVALLMTEIVKNLEGNRRDPAQTLRIEHLRLVTEVSWYFLLQETPVYPGWTDLLIRLMLEEGITEAPARSRPGNWNLVRLGEEVKKRLLPATKSSWEGREFGRAARVRQEFYLSAADVLRAQAEAVASIEVQALSVEIAGYQAGATPGGEVRPPELPPSPLPPASAFVTSFDVELEMALWKHGRKPFAVVVPVHVVSTDEADQEAEFCWLLAQMNPPAEGSFGAVEETLLRPGSWQVLTRRTEPVFLRSQPIVVHLNGCPMLELPRIPQESDGELSTTDKAILSGLQQVGVASRGRRFRHAVTVDEYLALRQAEAERFPGPGSEPMPKALPPSLLGDADRNERFWMAMGVPIADSAIRHRIVTQINLRADNTNRGPRPSLDPGVGFDEMGFPLPGSAPASDGATEVDRAPGAVAGVSINKRIRDNEASLLYWVGLDVVRADSSEFASELRHYAAHVREESAAKRPPALEACPLPTPAPTAEDAS